MKRVSQRGFTIVELLIVVVVIAILAAITIVAYNGVQQRATSSKLQSEVSQAVKKIETMKTASGTDTYPTAAALNLNSDSLSYYIDEPNSNNVSNNTYCVQSKKGNVAYSASSTTTSVVAGDCGERGLIGWWPFNNSPNDSSGNGNNGTLAGPPVAITGQDGQADHAYDFSAASSTSVTAAHSDALNDAQTFSFWIKPKNWSTANASTFIAKRQSSSNGFLIAYLNSSNSVSFDCGMSGSSNRFIPNYSPAIDAWTHIVFTCSTKSGVGVALYANGVSIATRTTVDRTATSPTAIRFGQDTSAASTYNFNGSMDDIRIYNRVLSAGEISSLFAAGAK